MAKSLAHDMDEGELEELYNWVDKISLSRPKKNISRDFADGVLAAEIAKHFYPKLVELHNYSNSFSKQKKIQNWNLLNRKVFKKLGFELGDDVISKVIASEPFAIEQVLMLLKRKINMDPLETNGGKEKELLKEGSRVSSNLNTSDRPEADQNMKVYPYQDAKADSKMKKATSLQHVGSTKNRNKSEMVPQIAVEEKEQEILAKEETIQILQAKVRRLEHLVHLKDIRIDDLNNTVKELENAVRRPKGIQKR